MAYAKKNVSARTPKSRANEYEPDLGKLWVKTDRNGNVMLSGVLETSKGDIRIVAFKNHTATEANRRPNFFIKRSKPMEEREQKQEEIEIETESEFAL